MAVLVIAGSGRQSGKTALGCALIEGFAEFRWAAVKVTPHPHQTGPQLVEETNRNSEKDTGRYLRAGAWRSFLVTAGTVSRAEEMTLQTRGLADECDGLLVESNHVSGQRIARQEERVVCLGVVTGSTDDRKSSLLDCAGYVDAWVVSAGAVDGPLTHFFSQRPVFHGLDGNWPGLLQFLRDRLL